MGIKFKETIVGSSEKYFAQYKNEDDSYYNQEKLKAAFAEASANRKFEIERYWDRAKYFWAFITSIYAAYFAVLTQIYSNQSEIETKAGEQTVKIISTIYTHGTFPLLVLSALGLFFCIAWILTNKGSSKWQENWEAQMTVLEDKVTGPLQKLYLKKSAPSVSKTNLAASYVVSTCSFGLFVFEAVSFCKNCKNLPQFLCFVFIFLLAAFGTAAFVLGTIGNTEITKEVTFIGKTFEEN